MKRNSQRVRSASGRRAPAPRPTLTCISGGPLVGSQTGGVLLVWEVPETHPMTPLEAALLADPGCQRLIATWPTKGYTRDYRKAPFEEVCAALDRVGTAYLRGVVIDR